jgi:hypothetical protein
MKFNFSPGTSLYISAGFVFRLGSGGGAGYPRPGSNGISRFTWALRMTGVCWHIACECRG